MRSPRFTLTQFFLAATTLAFVAMGALLLAFMQSSRRSIMDSSERLRTAAARRIEERVVASRSRATDVLEAIERDADHSVMSPDDPGAVEARLFSAVQNAPDVAGVTFTHARSLGFDEHDELRLAPDGRWQVSVFRVNALPNSPIFTRVVMAEDHRFVARRRERPSNAPFIASALLPEGDTTDPTEHDTFGPPASKSLYGTAVWSDLHYSELDGTTQSADRRVVVSYPLHEDAGSTGPFA